MKLHVASGEGGVHKINWQALILEHVYVSEIIDERTMTSQVM